MNDLRAHWEKVLAREGLQPLDCRANGQVFVRQQRMRKILRLPDDLREARLAWLDRHRFSSIESRQIWEMYCDAMEPRAIARRLGLARQRVKDIIKRTERARLRQMHAFCEWSPPSELPDSATVLEIFVEAEQLTRGM